MEYDRQTHRGSFSSSGSKHKKSLSWGDDGSKRNGDVVQQVPMMDPPPYSESASAAQAPRTTIKVEDMTSAPSSAVAGGDDDDDDGRPSSSNGGLTYFPGEPPILGARGGSPRRGPEKKPPVSGSAGLATGRGQLTPIGDDSWSSQSTAKPDDTPLRQHHARVGSQGTMISALTTDSFASPETTIIVPSQESSSGRPAPPTVEDRLMKKLLSMASHNNKNDKDFFDQLSYSISSVGSSRITGNNNLSSYMDSKDGEPDSRRRMTTPVGHRPKICGAIPVTSSCKLLLQPERCSVHKTKNSFECTFRIWKKSEQS